MRPVFTAVVMLLGFCACGPGARPHPSETPGEGRPGAPRVERLSFDVNAPSKPGRMHDDPKWQQAKTLDPVALAALADAEAAAGLLQGVRLGGALGNAGLHALAYASDAELALGPLCRLARELRGAALQAVLQSALRIANGLQADRERIGSDGILECDSLLPELRSQHGVAASQRDLADALAVRLQQLPR